MRKYLLIIMMILLCIFIYLKITENQNDMHGAMKLPSKAHCETPKVFLKGIFFSVDQTIPPPVDPWRGKEYVYYRFKETSMPRESTFFIFTIKQELGSNEESRKYKPFTIGKTYSFCALCDQTEKGLCIDEELISESMNE